MDASDKKEIMGLLKWLSIVVLAAIAIGCALMLARPSRGPQTLADANLIGRTWTEAEVIEARNVTHRQLAVLADALDRASKTGDDSIVMAVLPQVTSVLASWNDQPATTQQSGHNCIVAALHVSKGLDTAASRWGWARKQFDAALADCTP